MWIAQISDPHVRPEGVLYQGVVDSNAALVDAIAQVNALEPLPDLVLLTGDVVDEGRPDEYRAARRILSSLRPALRIIPGNHDDPTAFRAAFGDHAYLPDHGPMHYVDEAWPVRIVALDVTVPGAHHGEIDRPALDWLKRTLAGAPARPTIVVMHQPPLETGVPYLDQYRCLGGDALAAVISGAPAVERVLCGHVHRLMVTRLAGTVLVTAPSTATAIALQPWAGAGPASFHEPPGFLLHHWQAGRGMLTHSVPIGRFPGPFGFA